MSDVLTLLIVTLATYRIATDIAWTDGPGAVFARLRGWAYKRFGPESWIAQGLQCPVCVAFWAALPVIGAALWVPTLMPGLWWLAAAGGAALLARGRR